MTGFSGPVALEQTGDLAWVLTRPLTYVSLAGRGITVPVGSPTDGASVPRPVSWLVPRSGRYLPAAVVHDHLYRELVPAGLATYRHADQVLLEAMRLLGVSFGLRWAIFAAVRLAGLGRRGGRGGWWRDAPAVLTTTAVALPIIAVPTAAVAVGLLIVGVVEAALWLALTVAGRPDRYVNPPDLGPV